MKAERRHKLQQNALAHSLENLPKVGRESGSKLLLGIVTVLLIIVLVRFYLNSQESKKELIATELTNARGDLNALSGDLSMKLSIEQLAEARKKTLDSIEKKADAVQAETNDPAPVAQSKNILGDAYLQLATLGDPVEATTRPELALSRKPDDLLNAAEKSYQDVLNMKAGVPAAEVADAHFGLGAIAENRGDWDKARSQYHAVADDATMPKVFTDYGKLRLTVVDKISGPFVIGKPMVKPMELDLPPATKPSSAPAGPTGPTTGPSRVPAGPTVPAAGPSTIPATGPSTQGS